jgi:hypothetical protein
VSGRATDGRGVTASVDRDARWCGRNPAAASRSLASARRGCRTSERRDGRGGGRWRGSCELAPLLWSEVENATFLLRLAAEGYCVDVEARRFAGVSAHARRATLGLKILVPLVRFQLLTLDFRGGVIAWGARQESTFSLQITASKVENATFWLRLTRVSEFGLHGYAAGEGDTQGGHWGSNERVAFGEGIPSSVKCRGIACTPCCSYPRYETAPS